ncbi:MAG: type III pantothenate kinase [Oscillospiraceae bacterium]|jgi:type III pantothenate kinase|nr:type III pantothenate kinase [Oscillospiraceae bacterium]
MLLTIDAGNTNITLGVWENDTLRFRARLATERRLTADQLAMQLFDAFRLNGVDPAACTDAVIACVVAELSHAITAAARKLTGRDPLVVAPGVKTGLNIKIDDPAQLAADLIATGVGAKSLYPLPCLVIDLGTATKITVLAADGSLVGGIITAGLMMSMEALSAETSLLPRVALHAPPRLIGSNTVDCIQAGLVLGAAAMLDGLLERMEAELGQPAFTVATGGFAHAVIPHCKRAMTHSEDLALLGLRRIYAKNRSG